MYVLVAVIRTQRYLLPLCHHMNFVERFDIVVVYLRRLIIRENVYLLKNALYVPVNIISDNAMTALRK